LIQVILDNKSPIELDWSSDSIAFNLFYHSRKDGSKVRGEELFLDGVPVIRLTWNIRSNRFAIQKMFSGRDQVLLSEVAERGGDRGSLMRGASIRMSAKSMNTPAKLSTDELKNSVSDFFVSQLLLAGEMCLDRNYPVLLAIEKTYTYEMLLTMMKMCANQSVKSAAAYLIQQVYVNREPQSELPLPRYTRTLTEIIQSTQSEIVGLPPSIAFQFSFLQILIAEHLTEIKEKPFPQDSLNTLGLLFSLVKYHYFGSVDKLSFIVGLLINCLIRGEFDVELKGTDNDFGMSMKNLTLRTTSRKSLKTMNTARLVQTASVITVNTNSNVSTAEDDLKDISMKEPSLGGNDNSGWSDPAHKPEPSVVAKLLLEMVESRRVHLVMILFTLAAVGVTIWEVTQHETGFYMELFEAIVLAVFIWELVFHMVFYSLVHRTLLTFFKNPFNCFDVVTVILYLLALKSSRTASYAKFVRLVRLFAIYKFYNLVNDANLANEGADQIITWIPPTRFHKTSEYTINCLVQIVQILIRVQRNIEDRALSSFLKKFSKWQADPHTTLDQCGDVFRSVIHETADLAISNDEKDQIFMDLLMYSNQNLVQVTLDLLMMHHSSQKILLENINKLQLIASPSDEAQYLKLEAIVNSLKKHADTHEIWGKLETLEHQQISNEMHKNLQELIKDSKKLREVLKFDESYEPVKFVQNVLRNLGCFEVCIKISQFVLTLDNEDAIQERHKNTRKLSLESNQLLYWFCIDNPLNQPIAYGELKFFIKTVDSKIASNRVISAIFKDNMELMELVPKKYIGEFVELICTVGKFPQYLSLMSSIINVGEKNMISNQYEVIRLMSSPENVKKVTLYFVPPEHSEYNKKIRLMAHYLNMKDVSIDDIPSDLAYHLELMKLLSSCTIGTSGMTSIEAKVQSMYHFSDIIEGILDPNCLLLAKIRMGLFLYNAMLDVETPIPAIKDAACIWKLIIAAQDIFTFAKDELRQIEKNGWDSPTSNRQKVEFMLVNAMVIDGYFTYYYDSSIFKPDFGQVAVGVERISMKESVGNEIMQSLYQKILAIYEMMSPLLAPEHHALLFNTLRILNEKTKERMIAEVVNIHETFLKSAQDYQAVDEGILNKSYEKFVEILNKNEVVTDNADQQIQHFLEKIEQLPWKHSSEKSDLRFEPLVEKLISHVRSCVSVIIHGDDTLKFMNPASTKTSIWILKMFRTMIENRWGMTIYERDDDGGEEQDNAVIDLMKVFNTAGMTEMCLDLISKGIDIALQAEALKLLVGMLFKEGGALDIQKSIHAHLARPGSDMFFRTVQGILHGQMSWHKWNGVIILDAEEEPNLPDEVIIVRCLQLMCEGHYAPNQDLMREQPNNYTSINLLDDFVNYLQCLDPIKCRTSTAAELAVTAVVLEVIQGPCEGNQNYFASNTELIETLNRKIRQKPTNDCNPDEEFELKKACIDILQALLEGQGRKTAIYERMLSVIHIDVLLMLCRPADFGEGDEEGEDSGEDGRKAKKEEESEESKALKVESLVLLQMLIDFRPALKAEYGLADDFAYSAGDSVVCIEVVWQSELQRRFFHIPNICDALAKSTKETFVLTVKRDSPEDKLYGLLEAAKEMYREVTHQQYLKDIGIARFFSKTNQDFVTWANFSIVCVINFLFILFYTTERIECAKNGLYNSELEYLPQDDVAGAQINPDPSPQFCDSVHIPENEVKYTILGLNCLLIFGATFSLASSLVVRAPVNYQKFQEAGYGLAVTFFYTALDFFTIYYAFYLILAFLGLVYHPFLAFLLLDFITLSSQTQAVLMAVYEPKRAIAMSIVLLCIIMFIYAFFEVEFICILCLIEPSFNFFFRSSSSSLTLLKLPKTRKPILSHKRSLL
jgi:hypothetical protein